MRGQVEPGFTSGTPWHPPKSPMAVRLGGLCSSRMADGFFLPLPPPEALSILCTCFTVCFLFQV